MAENVWRRRAPLWLRIVAGLLVLPLIGLAVLFLAGALGVDTPLIWILPIAPALAWLIAFRASTPIAVAMLLLGPLGTGLIVYQVQRTFENVSGQLDPATGEQTAQPRPTYPYESHADEAPKAEAPGPDLGAPSSGGGDSAAKPTLPEFPWPPPTASTSYVLPEKLLDSYRTLGDVTGAILAALEQNGYVERSFFRTEPGGVALVTRLERINDDGSPSAEAERWPPGAQRQDSTRGLLDFLQGLFFVDPGHYRVIVFVLQDLPFSQSAETIAAEQAHAWLTSGANVLPREIAALPFAGGHVTVLIYEFASDGSKVQVVTSQLTGKQHLERAGVLAILDQVQ